MALGPGSSLADARSSGTRDLVSRASAASACERNETRDPYVDGPRLARDRAAARDRIACDHMSGLLSRSHMTAAKMGSATRVPNSAATLSIQATGSRGVSRVLGSIDHAICLVSSKLRPWRAAVSYAPNSGRNLIRSCGHLRMVEDQGFVSPTLAWARSAVRQRGQGWPQATAAGGATKP